MCVCIAFGLLSQSFCIPCALSGLCLVTGDFKLDIKCGEFTDSEIIVMLGENGTGKTTFIRMLAGRLEPDGASEYFV